MNKSVFLKKLNKKLKGLPVEDKNDAIRFYEDYIDEAGLGESKEIEKELGTPDEVARKILDDCMDKQMTAQSENPDMKNNSKIIWLVLLGILAAPVGFPLIIVALALLFSTLMVMISVEFAILVTGVALAAAGVVLVPAIFWAGGIGQKLVLFGCMFVGVAIGLLICKGFYKLGGVMVRWVAHIFQKIFTKNNRRRVG